MTTQFAIATLFEIILAAAAIWAIFSEKKLIEFEQRLVARFRSRRAGRHALIIPTDDGCSHSNCA